MEQLTLLSDDQTHQPQLTLRPYQQKAINMLYEWFEKNPTGNPCLVLPPGAGKGIIVAELCRDALQNWPETRMTMLTHSMELVEQNYLKLLKHWPGAPVGVYSAGLKQRKLDEPITFAGIQSISKRAEELGHQDIILVDEAHVISHKDQGEYRKLINKLTEINPYLRVVGLTASPWRLGHGLITDEPGIFNALLEPATVKELVNQKYLAPLRSKITEFKQDASDVKKRGGEYIESELQKALDTEDQNQAVVKEIITKAWDRQHWLIFCVGVSHAQHISDLLNENGIVSACVSSDTPTEERKRILSDFKAGKIRAVTNYGILTTGFDMDNIDVIAMLRPTMSPGLYYQICGRGTRLKTHFINENPVTDCLFLDFAGVVSLHGPITDIQPPPKKGQKGNGSAPTKTCKECDEICHASVRVCPHCGSEFPKPETKPLILRNDDIMGFEPMTMQVSRWQWEVYTSRQSHKTMLRVTYYGEMFDVPVSEYLTVLHGGHPGQKAQLLLARMMKSAGIEWDNPDLPLQPDELEMIADAMNQAQPPTTLQYRRDGKYHRVIDRHWEKRISSVLPATESRSAIMLHSPESTVLDDEIKPFEGELEGCPF